MKATDYIVEFLIQKGVTDIFGYPGGVVCHLIDSASKYRDKIRMHTTYHEQGAALAACGYAQKSNILGVAYATSGPGALNLVTGIANAYFDGVPTLFLTGQVDTYSSKGDYPIRQCGFQETDIVSVVKPITKMAVYVQNAADLPRILEECFQTAVLGRPGPVLIDLPADVQRSDIDIESCSLATAAEEVSCEAGRSSLVQDVDRIYELLKQAKKPCILVGSGISRAKMRENFRELCEAWNIPVVTSMNAIDLLPYDHKCQFGFIGANGHRCANQILASADLVISMGSRLDLKQVGNKRSNFLPNAKLVRIDIDAGELEYQVRNDEISICQDLANLIPCLQRKCSEAFGDDWLNRCGKVKGLLYDHDFEVYHAYIANISKRLPDECSIVTDCGQNQVWTIQACQLKPNQQLLTTGGLGTMGYCIPACVGACYAGAPQVVGFVGDGGIQMNIQELEVIARESLPITIVILNNDSLGMIRQFQENNFQGNYSQTTRETGYCTPDFEKIVNGYGIDFLRISDMSEIDAVRWDSLKPQVVEVVLPDTTYLLPRFGRKNGFSDAEPLLQEDLYTKIEKELRSN